VIDETRGDRWDDKPGRYAQEIPGPAYALMRYAQAIALDKFKRNELRESEREALTTFMDGFMEVEIAGIREQMDDAVSGAVEDFLKDCPSAVAALRVPLEVDQTDDD
jgi:hypothetical protein